MRVVGVFSTQFFSIGVFSDTPVSVLRVALGVSAAKNEEKYHKIGTKILEDLIEI